MDEIELIHTRYLTLRDAIVAWIREHCAGAAWHYRPTPWSNSTAWIVPHLIVFEQIKVYDRIGGYPFPSLVSRSLVERYKPGAAGYAMADAELMGLEEALGALARARQTTDEFLSGLRAGAPRFAGVDRGQVFERYLLNFTHDTEHYGQIKYLSGTYGRLGG